MQRSDAAYYRKRAQFLLADLTGIDPLDPRLMEFVECVEAAAVAVMRKELKKP